MFENKLVRIFLFWVVVFSASLFLRFSLSGSNGVTSDSVASTTLQAKALRSFAEANPSREPRVTVDTSIQLPEPSISISPDDFYTFEDILYIEGRSMPEGIITVRTIKAGEQPVKFIVKADSSGEWVVAEKTYLTAGNWEVSARAQIKDQISDWSNPRVIRSIATGVDIFGLKVRYVVIAVILLVFFALLGLILTYFLHRIRKLKRGFFEK